MNHISSIKKLISENHIERAISRFEELIIQQYGLQLPYYDQIINLKREFKSITKEQIRGTISYNEFQLAQNKLSARLLNLCNEFKPKANFTYNEELSTLPWQCYLLIILDQFKNGVWGASVSSIAEAYGHSNDPGSISTSSLCSLAIARFLNSNNHSCIENYRNYLIKRQSENGAFGMLKQIGSSRYSAPTILEHSRHTATAVEFFLYFDGFNYTRTQKGLLFLLKNRAPNGLWVDQGICKDIYVDPVTVGFVIYTFDKILEEIVKDKDGGKKELKDLLEESIIKGLDYLFTSPFKTKDGIWTYKYFDDVRKREVFKNSYIYTTDILYSIINICEKRRLYEKQINSILDILFNVYKNYGGIPSSPDSNIPHLDPSASFLIISKHSSFLKEKTKGFEKKLFKFFNDPDLLMKSNSYGWGQVLKLFNSTKKNITTKTYIDEIISRLQREDVSVVLNDTKFSHLAPKIIELESIKKIAETQ